MFGLAHRILFLKRLSSGFVFLWVDYQNSCKFNYTSLLHMFCLPVRYSDLFSAGRKSPGVSFSRIRSSPGPRRCQRNWRDNQFFSRGSII